MPDLSEFYGFDRGRAEAGRDGYVAYVNVYRRDTGHSAKVFSGEGRTQTSAIRAAMSEAKLWVVRQGQPKDWKPDSN